MPFSLMATREFVASLHEPGLIAPLIAGAELDEPLTKALQKLQSVAIIPFFERRASFLLLRC